MKTKRIQMVRFFSLLIFLIMQTFVFANEGSNEKGTIKGTVKEKENKAPVEYANVILYSKADSSLVAGTITDVNGNYELGKIPEGNYYMVCYFIGYKETVQDNITVESKKDELRLAPVIIEPDTRVLSDVMVEARQNVVSASHDKKVVNVKQNLNSKGGTAADALRNAPSVTTDAENNILVRGSSDYKVLINGKPTTMAASDVLRQTPADIIEKIEIITNPSVKYSAEGTAGIINIILKSELARGFNGMINGTVGTKDKYTTNATLNLNMEKIRLSTGIEWRDYTTTALNDYKRYFLMGDTTDIAWLYQDRVHNNKDLGFRFNADYTLSDKTSMAYSLNTGYTGFDINMSHNTHGYTTPESFNNYTASNFAFKIKPAFFTNNFSISHVLNEKGSNLSLNTYYSHISYEYANYRTTSNADVNFNFLSNKPHKLNIDNNNYSHDNRVDIDFTHPINEKTKFESGLSFNRYSRFIDVNFTEFDYNTNTWIVDPTFTNEFDFSENIYAVYALLSSKIADINFKVGMRAEFMDRELFQKTNEKAYSYSKWHFFPSFSVNKELENKQSLQLNYSHRINRPDEYMMNPFPEANDDYFYSMGNPFLIPEISHSVEFNYQKYLEKGLLSAQTYFKQTNDRIGQTLTLMDDGRVFLITDNNSTDKTTGVDLMANYELTKWWSVNANASLYHYYLSGKVEGIEFNRNSFQWSSRLVSSFNFKTNTSIQWVGLYNSKTLRKQGELSGFYMLDIAVNQNLFNKKLSLSFQMKDVFQSMNYELYNEHENMQLTGYFNNESPTFLVSISYSFNNFRKMTKDVQTEFDM